MTDATPPPLPPAPPPVDGEGPGRDVDQGQLRVFPCEGCGADLEFAIDVQSLRCPYCGHEKEVVHEEGAEVAERDLREALEAVAERRAGGEGGLAGISEVGCRDCGATVQFHGTLTSQECPYCGTPIQLDGVHDAEDRVPADGVLPFLVDRAQARANLQKWVSSRWFAPNAFRRRGADGKFSGVYMPYWTYDALTLNDYSGQRGEYYYVSVRRGDQTVRERRTRWYPASGSFRRFFDDVLVEAGAGLPPKVVRKLGPWPLERCEPFRQEFLAGYLARTYDIDLGDGFSTAKERMRVALHEDARRRIGGDTQRVHSVNTEFGALTYKHLLLPVWLLAYRYGDKSYQVVVNAATGEVQGERPYSAWKITFFVLAIVALVTSIALVAR